MEEILTRLEQNGNCKEMMRQACKRNGLNTALGGELTVPKLKLLNEKFKKAYALLKSKIKTNWIENQLKAYNWILIAISALENAKIADFRQNQWILLQNIFQFKTRTFLKFEARRFLQQKKSKNKNWSDQQNRLLLKIVNEMENSKLIKKQEDQKELQQQSPKIESSKSPKQNQSIQNERKGKWTDAQDNALMRQVETRGKKWAEIATILQRTQHTVKNRFHSLQMKQKKENKKRLLARPKKVKISIQEPKIQRCPIKEEAEKIPIITITEFADSQRGKQGKNQLQIDEFVEEVDDCQLIQRSDDISKSTKSEFWSCSPFLSYSPRNITPGIGSPSPFPFSMRSFASNNFDEFVNKGSARQ